MPFTTTFCGLLIKCPKRVLENGTQNPLIFQSAERVVRLAEKDYFLDEPRCDTKLHVSRTFPKYRSPAGDEWSGRGRVPVWLRLLEDEGHNREEFRVNDAE